MVQTMEHDGDGQCDCPVCGEYHGTPQSVEAHITGKSDDAHRGQVGKDYRVVEDGERRLSTEPDPDLKGTVPEIGLDSSETESEPETELKGTVPETDQNSPETELEPEDEEQDNRALSAILVTGLFIAVLWLARRTGNEDQIRDPTETVSRR